MLAWRPHSCSRSALLLLALAVLLSTCAVFYLSQRYLVDAADSVKYTLQKQQTARQVLNTLLDAETGQRGYLLTSDARYLRPYDDARALVDSRISALASEFADDPKQLRLIHDLQSLSRDKLNELEKAISAHVDVGAAASLAIVREDKGRKIMDQIRSIVGEIESTSEARLRDSSAEYRRTVALSNAMLVLFTLTALSVLAALYWVMGREVELRERATQEHVEYAANLDSSIKELERERNAMAVLNELSNFLQSCQTISDVGELAGRSLGVLLPDTSGALYLYSPDRLKLSAAASWGDVARADFQPSDCWALRRGQSHAHTPLGSAPLCGHLSGHSNDDSLCIPVMAQGEALGLLTIHRPAQHAVAPFNEEVRRLGLIVARQLGATLANLKLRETLNEQSLRDPLTNAFNRRHFEVVGEKELALAKREDLPLAVVMLDVDHFKLINDIRGHAAGDATLVAVSSYLQKNIRNSDWLFRYGGEEFVLVLSDVGHAAAVTKARELCAGIAELGVVHDKQLLPRVTVSMGVACYPEHGTTIAALIERADEALYASKEAGRNRVTMAGRAA